MSETAHTPTPWTFRIHSDWEDNFHLGPLNEEDGDILHTLLEGGLVLSDEENAANAALIVTAVNAHEAMKEALKRARHELQWAYDCMDVPPADGILEGLHKAIDLAEGQKE